MIEKVDVGSKRFSIGKYLRVRLTINILKPLCRGRVVCMGGTKQGWVDFRYECLPIFCYWCGKLDHDDRDRSLWIDSKESLEMEERKFGPWLRTDTKWLQRPHMAEVPTRKKGEEGKSKWCGQQSNNHPTRNNLRLSGVVPLNDDGEVLPPPKMTTTVTDMVMDDVTPHKNELEDFEEQLREIDYAIITIDILQETTGNQAPKRENTIDLGYSNLGQPEVLGAGVREKASTIQLPSPCLKYSSSGLYGLSSRQHEA